MLVFAKGFEKYADKEYRINERLKGASMSLIVLVKVAVISILVVTVFAMIGIVTVENDICQFVCELGVGISMAVFLLSVITGIIIF